MNQQGVLFEGASGGPVDGPSRWPNTQWIVARADAEKLLTLSSREFSRLEAQGIVQPFRKGHPGLPSTFDAFSITAAYIRFLRTRRHGPRADDHDRRDRAAVEIIELKLGKLRGELIRVDEIRDGWARWMIEFRNSILGVPTWLKQAIPTLTRADILSVDQHLRTILKTLADGGKGNGKADHDEPEQ
jgi:phage terminase Nu1 subunit (DNA packaging protein)